MKANVSLDPIWQQKYVAVYSRRDLLDALMSFFTMRQMTAMAFDDQARN